jgi:hypothetical protein
MERSSKRGKIPQQDWPSIIQRYEAGETLSSIARTYDCSPPAISYILSRSRTREIAVENNEPNGTEAPESALVKAPATVLSGAKATQPGPEIEEAAVPAPAVPADKPTDASVPEPVSVRPGPSLDEATGAPAPDPDPESTMSGTRDDPVGGHAETFDAVEHRNSVGVELQLGEPRRTLHLSLSHNSDTRPETSHRDRRDADMAGGSAAQQAGGQPARTQHLAGQNSAPYASNNGGAARSVMGPEKTREGSAFIDRALRERVNGDISAFLAAFDAALADDTIESRSGLREATDRLLRAGARTRIELERLEARVPLPARAPSEYQTPNWRPR